MLKIIFHLAIAALAAVSLSSCYTDFEPDIPSDPVLCLNSVIEAGKPVTVDLSRTWRYSDGSYYDFDNNKNHTLDTRVMDASVSLYVGDVLKETVDTPDVPTSANQRDRSFYSFDYVACPGDDIRLVAVSKKYGEAEGSVTVPHPVDVESIDFTPTSVKVFNWGYPNIEFGCAFKLTFTDPAGTRDFYRVTAEPYRHEMIPNPDKPGDYYFVDFRFNGIDCNVEPLFSEHAGILDLIMSGSGGMSLFTDRQIQGKTYPLDISLSYPTVVVNNPEDIDSLYDAGVVFRFCSVSESYYTYFLLDWVMDNSVGSNLSEAGLSDLVEGYSNVSTRAGIICAFSPREYRYSLRDFIKNTVADSNSDAE